MKTTMWWSVATLSLAMSTVRALTYMGQVYGVTVLSPNSTEPCMYLLVHPSYSCDCSRPLDAPY